MHDKEQGPILGEPNCRVALFFIHACIDNPKERIEEDLARGFKVDAVFGRIAGRLLRILHKALAV